jgi:hypothetical protein
MTAYPTSDVFAEITRRGSIEYLEKPFDFEQFLGAVERALRRVEAPRVGFSGAILAQTLPDVIQLYVLSNATGALHVSCREHRGIIWFDRGTIPHAVAGAREGAEAFSEILRWQGGEFSMDLHAATTKRSISVGWMELIMDACRVRDEQERGPDTKGVERGWTLVPPPEVEAAPDASARAAASAETSTREDGPRASAETTDARRDDATDARSTTDDTKKGWEGLMANIKDSLAKLDSIDGFIGACLCDSESGMVLGTEGGGAALNLEIAGASNTEVVRAKRKAAKNLNLKDDIEDMLITLGKQYHLIRPLKGKPTIFFYLALDRSRANLAMARLTLADVEKDLQL